MLFFFVLRGELTDDSHRLGREFMESKLLKLLRFEINTLLITSNKSSANCSSWRVV